MKRLEKIEEIRRKENRFFAVKEWLVMGFFIISIILFSLIRVLVSSIGESDFYQSVEIGKRMIESLSVYCSLLIVGYIIHSVLTKKVKKLSDSRMELLSC